jgi:hypothetical protein
MAPYIVICRTIVGQAKIVTNIVTGYTHIIGKASNFMAGPGYNLQSLHQAGDVGKRLVLVMRNGSEARVNIRKNVPANEKLTVQDVGVFVFNCYKD